MDINNSADRPDIISPHNWKERAELNLRALHLLDDNKAAVFISPNFRKSVRLMVDELMKQQARPVPARERNERMPTHVRKIYLDISEQLVGRVRKDLNADEVSFLHFALIKSVITVIAESYRDYFTGLRKQADELKKTGEGKLLKVQEHLTWLNNNTDLVMYRILKPVFRELKRISSGALEESWQQINNISLNSSRILFSPILQCRFVRIETVLLRDGCA